jgi:phage gp36-like protein
MAWVVPSIDDLLARLSQPELAALQTAATQPGQVDRIQSNIKWAIALVRGRTGACARFRGYIGSAGTIPDELYGAFIDIARFRVLNSLPVQNLVTEARRKDYDSALADLEAVARGEIEIAQGSDPSGQPPLTIGAHGGEKQFPINPVHRHPWWDAF